ncbi:MULTISPECIES: coiled-coil domain-containing protein [unclassified Micromonospora]|uniref:coiled-coil domain-containing protein n=1 Tax=Micromonospora sp. NPDC005206 TaxID=3157022 RepID=UPI0033A199A9
MTAPLRRWLTPVVAVIAALTVLAGPLPAQAAPTTPTPSGHEEDGEPQLLNDVIEQTNRKFSAAKSKLNTSKKKQLQLALEVDRAKADLNALAPQVGQIAAQSYRTGRIGPLAMLLESEAPDSFVQRAAALDEMNMVNEKKLAEVNAVKTRAEQAKLALDAEVREQQKQTALMAKEKREADKALALVGGKGFTGGLVSATSPVARLGPGRTADGDWKSESCSQNDPTTSGCVTPRTLHAYKEVKRAGFNRFVGCYRSGGPWEHPKGRACDWSLQKSGFSPWHNEDTRTYGNNVAAFLIRNADRLGIYYVIWNRQIWFPATGWKSYSGPSNHTDHVHMSLL